MTQKKREPLMVVHMDVRKLKPEPDTNLPSVSKARLEKLIAEAVVDAYTEQEQAVGFLTMIQDHLVLPFSVNILGVEAVVEKVDMTRDGRIVAVCRRDNVRQRIGRSGATDAHAGRRGMDRSISPLEQRVLS